MFHEWRLYNNGNFAGGLIMIHYDGNKGWIELQYTSTQYPTSARTVFICYHGYKATSVKVHSNASGNEWNMSSYDGGRYWILNTYLETLNDIEVIPVIEADNNAVTGVPTEAVLEWFNESDGLAGGSVYRDWVYISPAVGYTIPNPPKVADNDGKKTAVWKNEKWMLEVMRESAAAFTIDVVAVAGIHKVTAALNNCSGDYPATVSEGKKLTVTLTADASYTFYNAPTLHYTLESGAVAQNFTISEAGKKATISLIIPDGVKGDITITAAAEKTRYPLTVNLVNCKNTTDLPEYVTSGQVLSVTLDAVGDAVFDLLNAPKFTYNDMYGDSKVSELNVSENKKQATGEFSVPTTKFYNLTLTGAAFVSRTYPYGAINVYEVTNDILKQFAAKRFITRGTTENVTYLDVGEYVNRIHKLFVTVPADNSDTIKCGKYNLNIPCNTPSKDIVNVDFGTVTIPAVNGNTTDFDGKIEMFVPFKGFVSLPSDFAGLTVRLTYDVNVITGNGVAKVWNGDNIIMVDAVTPSTQVIYKTSLMNGGQILGGDEFNEQNLYGLEPFVYMTYYQSMNNKERNAVNVSGKIGSFGGFNVFSNIDKISGGNMLADEQTEIFQKLESGVYIED